MAQVATTRPAWKRDSGRQVMLAVPAPSLLLPAGASALGGLRPRKGDAPLVTDSLVEPPPSAELDPGFIENRASHTESEPSRPPTT